MGYGGFKDIWFETFCIGGRTLALEPISLAFALVSFVSFAAFLASFAHGVYFHVEPVALRERVVASHVPCLTPVLTCLRMCLDCADVHVVRIRRNPRQVQRLRHPKTTRSCTQETPGRHGHRRSPDTCEDMSGLDCADVHVVRVFLVCMI